ncbi:hypothetical protein BBK82_40380 [Lentzea guizhouensis]|uniref:Uncharacterized protein n=1 Tax=Lentzea guizhouensis TaxID=1586287 RepID=A0A1B2HUB7_9PSEU|nr:hypothetical protein [Lentzea guizhouensis]ANZ41297.1 hypothetical protein BBK82_40380 [Lentzea guizhouensis]
MNAPASQFLEELKVLRKGYALGATDLVHQVGPALRDLCGATADDGSDQLRAKLTATLRDLVDQLPDRVRPMMVMAFSVNRNSGRQTGRFLARVAAFAQAEGITERTVTRHIDAAMKPLAELAARWKPGRPGGASWRITRLQVFLNFDLTVPEVLEIRQIEALHNDVTELDLEMTLTPLEGWQSSSPLEHMGVDLFYGGKLSGSAQKGVNRVAFLLRLPRPLQCGDKHEYAIRISLPAERALQPLYMCTPRHRCEWFDLHVRFPEGGRPAALWRVAGLSPLQLDDPHGRQPVAVDRFGDVRATFTDLEAHLSYGLGWAH